MKAHLVYEVYRKKYSVLRRTEKMTFPRGSHWEDSHNNEEKFMPSVIGTYDSVSQGSSMMNPKWSSWVFLIYED